MLENVKIGTSIKMRTATALELEGSVRGIERSEDDENTIVALLLETPSGTTRWVDLTIEVPLICVIQKRYLN